jgi:hypothetical protein
MKVRTLILPIMRWITLTFAGGLGYALVRGLWAVRYLGAPIYDWFWYVPIIALLIGPPVSFTLRLQRKSTLLIFAVLLIFALISYNGFGQVVHLEPGNAPPVPISFWAFSDFRHTPAAILQDLEASGGRIYLHVGDYPFNQVRGQDLIERLRPLNGYNIEVYLVPPAPDFLSSAVYREWSDSVRALAAFVKREGLTNVRGLIGDAEPLLNQPMDIIGAEQANFDQAVIGLRDLINAMHSEYPDLRIGVTATSAHYLDGLDGDPDLAVAMRSPVDPPGRWDFLNVMTYSSYFPSDWRAYYVYLVERGMARRYSTGRVSHLIGLVGGGFPWEPVLDFDSLVRDARLSRALGVREIVVFQLDGALQQFGQDFIRRLTSAVNGPQSDLIVPFSRPASMLVYSAAAADALLDVRGQRVWLWIVWAIVCTILIRTRN